MFRTVSLKIWFLLCAERQIKANIRSMQLYTASTALYACFARLLALCSGRWNPLQRDSALSRSLSLLCTGRNHHLSSFTWLSSNHQLQSFLQLSSSSLYRSVHSVLCQTPSSMHYIITVCVRRHEFNLGFWGRSSSLCRKTLYSSSQQWAMDIFHI